MNTDTLTRKLDLQRFCANDIDPRGYLRAPWRSGKWVYATNGHIAVQVPAEDHPDVPETDAKVPDVGGLFDKAMNGRELVYLPMPAIPRLAACFDCEGKGKVRCIKCADCTDGEFRHGLHLYDCKNCEESPAGVGWEFLGDDESQPHEVTRTCQTCEGLGHDRKMARIRVGEADYSGFYLSLLAALPNVLICPGGPTSPAVLVFDGGHGLLMPMTNWPNEEHHEHRSQ